MPISLKEYKEKEDIYDHHYLKKYIDDNSMFFEYYAKGMHSTHFDKAMDSKIILPVANKWTVYEPKSIQIKDRILHVYREYGQTSYADGIMFLGILAAIGFATGLNHIVSVLCRKKYASYLK